MKEIANIWECKVGNNVNIVNFVSLLDIVVGYASWLEDQLTTVNNNLWDN